MLAESESEEDDAWDLEMELLCMPCRGGNVKQVARLASKITRACAGVPAHVSELARIAGKAGSNIERNWHRWVKHQPWRKMLPELYEFDVPWSPDSIHLENRKHFCLLPHEVVSVLSKFPELFENLITGPPGACTQFWDHARTHGEWLDKHPLREEIDAAPEVAFPLGLHGDDASAFHQHAKVLVLTFNSLSVSKSTLDNRLVFTAVNLLRSLDETLDVVYKVFVWSLNALAQGKHPKEDHLGKPFSLTHHPDRFKDAGKYLTRRRHRGIWSELRGDWKWQHEALHLESYYNADYMCHLCRAHKKIRRLLYTQFSRDATVRRTHISWARFRNWYESNPEDRSPLTHIIGFTIWRCWVDCMHDLDLGIYQIICACALLELVDEHAWRGNNNDERMARAHGKYVDWCQGKSLQPCAPFDRAKLRPSGHECPCFTYHQCKGSQMKWVLFWLESVMLARAGAGEDRHARVRRVMLSSFVAFGKICQAQGAYLSEAAAHAIPGLIENALLCYNALMDEAIGYGTYMWHILPKAHMASHMAYDFVKTGRNPRTVTCYPDEDMIGRVKKIVEACHGATYADTSLKRYMVLVGTRWWTLLTQLRFGSSDDGSD